jgi:hypothetical protein
MKICEDFVPNFGDKRTGCCITITHHLTLPFSPGNFLIFVLHPPYFYLFPRLKIKIKSHHFDTIEIFEAGVQVVLNTLTQHDFQDAFKKWQKCWEWCICVEGDYFKGQ